MHLLKTGLLVGGMLFSTALLARPINVVASFSVLGDMVHQIGGEEVRVTELVGPGGDPHEFEPAPKDSVLLAHADIVFINGLGLEGWMERLIMASGYRGEVVVTSTGVKARQMQEEGKMLTDPHAWNSLSNGVIYAQNITRALAEKEPGKAAYFQQRGKAYIRQLEQLDHETLAQFAHVPPAQRKVLTSHDAFGYFGQAYGVTFLSPLGYSTDTQASAGKVADLIRQIKQEHVSRYFIESQTDSRLVKQIAGATGAQPGGELYPEALTADEEPAGTYLKAFKHNVRTLINSMLGKE